MKSLIISLGLDSKKLLDLLIDKGIAVIPNFLDETTIKNINNEFDQLVNEPDSEFIKRMDYSMGKGVIIYKSKLDRKKFKTTFQIFSNSLMNRLTKNYLGQEVKYNEEIFVVNDVVGSKHHANDMHFDVLHTFKYFIYLTDTTVDNGAFTCVPGSHKRTAEIRKKLGDKISFENRELSRDLPYTENEVIAIEGTAGTLIIFDTDVFHKAGTVSKGERKVMRGHNRITKEKLPQEKKGLLSKIKSVFKKN